MGGLTIVALGANLPAAEADRIAVLRRAADRIGRDLALPGSVRRSGLYRTPAYPAGIGEDFVNACMTFESEAAPDDILAELHAIEAGAGRFRAERWGERPLDLDLLGVGDMILPCVITQTAWRTLAPEAQARVAPDRLILPHPRLQDRAFVLVPLADVAPRWRHPVLERDVARLLRDLGPDARQGIERIGAL